MAFEQLRLDKSINQSRGIFDKFIYSTFDSVDDVLSSGYFAKSRFTDDWPNGIIEAECSDGYIIGKITPDGQSVEILNIPDSNVFIVTGDRTTEGNELIVCNNTNPIAITLNPSPNNREKVTVIRANTGAVTVSGAIIGSTNLTIGNRYSSATIIYIDSLSEWFLI